ncbi:hypothetical protein MPER_09966 [Moniliophthora perniciosa FA553]|nr:hypothetical protein MPER_09966 [Moniliophthora perniciosa FA553]
MDQTRRWFYTLLVLSTHLFGTAPWKNLIVTGLVLAEDGKKMSKSLKNYPDPNLIIHQYGADATRMFLVNSPIVRGDNLRFREAGVREVISRVLLPWLNSFRFFLGQAALLKKTMGHEFKYNAHADVSKNVMDRWILARCQSLIKLVTEEMAAYRLYTVIPRLLELVDELTNWYIRFNRKRLKGEDGLEDTVSALNTLFETLFTLCRTMLAKFVADLLLVDSSERALGVHTDGQYLADIKPLQRYIESELNVRDIVFLSDENQAGVRYRVVADWGVLGRKLRKDLGRVKNALPNVSSNEVKQYLTTGKIVVDGIPLVEGDLTVQRYLEVDGKQYGTHTDNDVVVRLDIQIHPELQGEWLARELINRVQKLRKKAGLQATDDVEVYYTFEANTGSELLQAMQEHTDLIRKTVGTTPLSENERKASGIELIREEQEVYDTRFYLTLVK